MWAAFVKENSCYSVAEVGVWKGEFAASLLANCPAIKKYILIDSWRHLDGWNKPFNISDYEFEDVYRQAMDAVAFAREKVRVLRGMTLEVRDQIEDESLDFAYIDGDHSLRGIVIDAISMWPKIKVGGWLGGDDFTETVWQHSRDYEPSLVNPFMRYFADAVGEKLMIMPHGQFALQKTGGSGVRNGLGESAGCGLLPLLQDECSTRISCQSNLGANAAFPVRRFAKAVLRRVSRRFGEWENIRRTGAPFPKAISDTGLLFIHVPKSAGTSISLELYGFPIGHRCLEEWTGRYPFSSSRLHAFAVLRDPIQRFVSAFEFLKAGGMNKGDAEFARKHLRGFDSPETLALSLVDPKKFQDISTYWHFMPQTSFIEVNGRIPRSLKLFDFANLKPLEVWAAEKTKRSISIPDVNKKKSAQMNELHDNTARAIVEATYREDIELYRQVRQVQ